MKFLTICTMKDTAFAAPPGIARQAMEATVVYNEELKKAGKLLEIYAIPGGGAVVICEHPDVEDFTKTIAEIPAYSFMNFKVYPLSDMNKSMKTSIDVLKNAESLFAMK